MLALLSTPSALAAGVGTIAFIMTAGVAVASLIIRNKACNAKLPGSLRLAGS